MMPTPTLQTARLILRPFEEADDELHAAIWAKLEVVRFFQPKGEAEVIHAQRNARLYGQLWRWGAERGGIVPFAAVERASSRLIGHLGVRIHSELRVPELTLFLDSAAWKQGYATEGATAALDHAFEAHDLEEVLGVVMPDNIASHRVMQKLGFEAAAPLLQWKMVMTSYRLPRERWRASISRRDNSPSA